MAPDAILLKINARVAIGSLKIINITLRIGLMSLVVCSRLECQTSAGCKCGESKPWGYRPSGLSVFSDDEIAAEHHWRMMKKLGDPRTCVSGTSVHLE